MADIQSAAAEIRRGIRRRRRRKKQTTEQKYNGMPYYIGGHKNERDKTA